MNENENPSIPPANHVEPLPPVVEPTPPVKHSRKKRFLIIFLIIVAVPIFVVSLLALVAKQSRSKIPSQTNPGVSISGNNSQSGVVLSNKIVFDSNRTGNYEIYKMDLKTGQVTQLTSNSAYDNWWAKPSPDGKEMVFNRTPAGSHDLDYGKVSLWKANIDGSNARQIIANKQYGWGVQGHAEWSPDGKKLVMFGGISIWITDTEGKRINPVINGIDPIWNVDGSKIIYIKCKNAPACTPKTHQLASVNLDGTSPHDITPVLPQLSANDPTISPDGSTITWEANINFISWDLLAINSDGSNLRTLFKDDLINSSPIWSPDGKLIYFFKTKLFHEINVWTITPDGKDLTIVTKDQPGISEFPEYIR